MGRNNLAVAQDIASTPSGFMIGGGDIDPRYHRQRGGHPLCSATVVPFARYALGDF